MQKNLRSSLKSKRQQDSQPNFEESPMTPYRQGMAVLAFSPSANVQLPIQSRRRLFADITNNTNSIQQRTESHLKQSFETRAKSRSPPAISQFPPIHVEKQWQDEFYEEEEELLQEDEEKDEVEWYPNRNKKTRYFTKNRFLFGSAAAVLVCVFLVLVFGRRVDHAAVSDSVAVPEVDGEPQFETPGIEYQSQEAENVEMDDDIIPEEQDAVAAHAQFDWELYETKQIEKFSRIVKEMITEALDEYHLKQIGQADYASSDAGASIVEELTSKTCQKFLKTSNTSFLKEILKIFRTSNSNPHTTKRYGPHMAISDPNTPGNCWPMEGTQGYMAIKLARPIHPHSFTIEHISSKQALEGNVSSAPRDFEVYAQVEDEFKLLGKYNFDPNSSDPKQTFHVQNNLNDPISIVQLRIMSNNGRSEFTCLYRFRVHGDPSV